jgi:hypothetical protein
MTAPVNPKGANGDSAARALAKAPFAASLRARPETIQVGGGGSGSWMVRAQLPEVWDMVRLEIAPTASVRTLKQHALAQLKPDAESLDEFVTKLNGIEVLDEDVSLADAGARSGSTFLITYRRRRPVR